MAKKLFNDAFICANTRNNSKLFKYLYRELLMYVYTLQMNAEDIELNIRNTQRSLEFTRTQTFSGSLFSTFNPVQTQADVIESQNESILDKYIGSEK